MILGQEWKYLTGGYLSLDGSHITISHNRKNIIILRELGTMPYVKNVPGLEIIFSETGLDNYSVFMEDEKEPCAQPATETDECWHMHFHGASYVEGNDARVILFLPTEKPYQYSLRLNFECTNNILEFEALTLGLREASQLGCRHLQTFGDSE